MTDPMRNRTERAKRAYASGREYLRNKKIAFFMLWFLILVAAFVAGFLIRSNLPLMASLGFQSEDIAAATSSSPNSTKLKTTYDSLSMRISEVEDMLASYSLDDVNLEEATNSMLTELMESTGDPYAAYFDPERYEKYMMEDAERGFSGVGVLFGDYNGRAYAIDVLSGSEAQAAGVQQGDFVEAIDGDSSHIWSAAEVIGALSREDGESVIITWMHPISLDATTGETFTTTLVCRTYDMQNVTYEMSEDVGYIKLRQITGNSSELVQAAVEDLTAQGALAFVLDITDNPGGYLTQSLDIASMFVPSGVLVGIETQDGTSTRAASGTTITSAPLVVMINGYTSGVAEVLAAALQDNNRATTVGQTTTGKGSVQVIRELSFGGAVRYTAAYYLTPLGHEINGVGVVPDINVANPPDAEENFQLQVALDTARSLIGAQ